MSCNEIDLKERYMAYGKLYQFQKCQKSFPQNCTVEIFSYAKNHSLTQTLSEVIPSAANEVKKVLEDVEKMLFFKKGQIAKICC